MSTAPTPVVEPSAGIKHLVDYGPLVVFFLVNFLVPATAARGIVSHFTRALDGMAQVEMLLMARVILATAAFVIASAAALVLAKVKLGRVPPLLLISAGLVLVFGGLTMYFRDARFIQMKPTIVYALLSGVLLGGLVAHKPLLRDLLGSTYPGLSEAGWRRLTINWILFFAAMAIANEAVWRGAYALYGKSRGWDLWAIYKLWVVIPLTLIFAIANVPMLLRHGAQLGQEPPLPPEG
ncbi:inner membrane-spanning protein YciB [Sphingomonas sp. Mn802worker]|uniref:inner membrane-spanning protein YciB n=1 Tax=Sphingomonas sp. Mn802worker TaxID=629773 RepID=UPI00036637F8|nr:septation protein IspZ [Sphingomonas sp. Mn802worker]